MSQRKGYDTKFREQINNFWGENKEIHYSVKVEDLDYL